MKTEMKIGMLGFGTVGTGVAKLLIKNGELIRQRVGLDLRLARIADLDLERDRGVPVPRGVLTNDARSILRDPEIDVIVELIGGYEPARSFVLEAIAAGKHVVTANKALLALHGDEIFAAAERHKVSVMFEAAVAGGIPIINALLENLGANRFTNVVGILNGTCNYILTRMTQAGEEFATVLREAQDKGYAEADPTFDVEGIDTAHKLALLISLCFGTRIPFDQIYTEGISAVSPLDIQFAQQFGYRIKLLAIGKCSAGQIEARVHPTMIPAHYPLADVNDVFNAVRVVGDFVGPVMLYGRGAGMAATGSAVVGDLMAIARNLRVGISCRTPALGCLPEHIAQLPIRPMDEVVSQFYLRFGVTDQPGVMAQIAGALGKHNISIASMIQPERKIGEAVPIVLLTHEAREADIRQALAEINALPVMSGPSRFIRIENELE